MIRPSEAKNAPLREIPPQMGYLSPAPIFIRTARVVLAATVRRRNRRCRREFLVSRPSFIRDLGSSAHVDRGTSGGHTIYPQRKSEPPLSALGQLTTKRQATRKPTRQRRRRQSQPRPVCPLPGNSPKTTVVPLVEATETPAPSTEQVKKKAMKKPNVTSHYAWRGADSGRLGGAYTATAAGVTGILGSFPLLIPKRCHATASLRHSTCSAATKAEAAAFSSLERYRGRSD